MKKIITPIELLMRIIQNIDKLPITGISEIENNIEKEMECIHFAQLNGLIDNNIMVYYEGDGCTVQMSSYEKFHISIGLPQEKSNFVYIRNLYVPKKHRYKNIGRTVFKNTLKQAKERGCESIQVEATKESFNFWCKLGFEMLEVENLRMIYHV